MILLLGVKVFINLDTQLGSANWRLNPCGPCTADILDGDIQHFHQTVDWLPNPENMHYRDLTTFPLDNRLATRSRKYRAIGCPNKNSTDLKNNGH